MGDAWEQDEEFGRFLLRVLPREALKQSFMFYKSIDHPYLDFEQKVQIGRNLIAASQLGEQWKKEDK